MKRWNSRKRGWRLWGLGSTLIVLFLIQLVVMPSAVQADTPTLTLSQTSATYVENDAGFYADAGIQIAYSSTINGAKVSIGTGFSASQDQLLYSTTAGISGSYSATTGVLTLTGAASASSYQAALRAVRYYNSSDTPSTKSRVITFSLSGGSLYNETNGHYYEFVSAPNISWTNAYTGAASRSLFGLQGYLATITSQQENDFLTAKVSGTAWIGANDAASEGTWQWVTGPEAGNTLASYSYSNWAPLEPNNSGGSEDYGHMMSWTTPPGQWNDLADAGGSGQYASTGYVVEYGGMSGDPVVQLSASISVTVEAVNDPPVVGTIGAQGMTEDVGRTVSLSATDAEGNTPITFSVSGGSVSTVAGSVLGNQLTLAPATNYFTSSPIAFTVTAIDSLGASSSATFDVTVAPANDAPSFVKGANQTVLEDCGSQSVSGWATSITAGPANESGQTLNFNVANSYNALFSVQPAISSTGILSYTPAANQNGTATITVTLTDDATAGGAALTTAPQTFTITVSEVNDAPTAAADSFSMLEDGTLTLTSAQLLSNDLTGPANESAQTLVMSGVGTSCVNCSVSWVAGTITVHPTPDYSGSASFEYTIRDNGTTAGVLIARYATGTVNLTVTAVGDIVDDAATTAEDAAVVVSVLANDSFEGTPVITAVAQGVHGTVVIDSGDTSVTYTPYPDHNGTDNFTYTVSSPAGVTETATVTVTVTAVNDLPVNTAPPSISGTMNVGDTLTANPGTWNDTIDTVVSGSSTLSYAYQWVRADDVSGTNAGDIASATATTYVLSNADAHKYLHVRVTCTDSGVGLPATQSATLVTSWTSQVVNRLPVITEGASASVTMDEDGSPLAWSLELNATDADSDTLTWSIETAATYGTATASGTGSSRAIGYTPTSDDNGPDSFVVQVSDAYGGTDTITANVTVTPVNDMPSFTKGADQTVLEDCGAQTVALWATAISAGPANEFPQVLTFTVTGNTNPALFSVVPAVNSAGTLTYTPAPDANGEADVTLTLTDDATRGGAALTTAPQTFKITVTAVNDVPSFTRGANKTVLEDCGAQTVNSWATAISKGPADEAGQILHFDVSNGNNALFIAQPAVSPTGILTYTPAADMNGSATVTLHIHDNGGVLNGGVDTSADQTFIIRVTPVNDPPVNTALPAISGIPHIGCTLTTTDGAWNDLIDTSVSGGTSVLSYVYQWQRSTDGGSNFTPIPGATSSSYLLALPDNLQKVRVQVTCSDTGVGLPASQSTTAMSLPVTILNAAPVITEGPVISTSCDEDESPAPFSLTLHATDSDNIDTLTWHILTPPAHGTLILPADLTGLSTTPVYHPALDWNGMDSFTLRVEDGLTGTALITVSVTVNPRNDPPVNTLLPSITGNLLVNYDVRAVVGNWNDAIDTDVSGTSVLSYTYQWLRARDAGGAGLVLIPGGTASTYVVSMLDGGMYVAVRVTCTDGGVGLPATMSTTVDSAFLSARSLDMMLPTIDLPDFSSWPGATGWSGGVTPSFTVNRSPFNLQFMVADDRSSVQGRVLVNGVEVSSSVGTGTINRSVSLTEGTNRVNITAVDEGGNRAERHFTITLDTHAPVVVLSKPLIKMVTGTTLNVEGSITDDLAGVRSLTFDGTEVIPYLDGTFTVSIPLKRGLNIIAVETLDNAGNRGSLTWTLDLTSVQQPHVGHRIDLTIDKKVMVVDGANVTMDVAPVILQSRTLLPLRALVEEVGGTIAWNATTRQVAVTARGITMVLTIGKNTATVNGKSTLIDPANSKVVPIILRSRTFLPVRFIAEQLGLGVAWDAPTRTVTITWEP